MTKQLVSNKATCDIYSSREKMVIRVKSKSTKWTWISLLAGALMATLVILTWWS